MIQCIKSPRTATAIVVEITPHLVFSFSSMVAYPVKHRKYTKQNDNKARNILLPIALYSKKSVMEGDPKKHKVSDLQQAYTKLDIEIARALERDDVDPETAHELESMPQRICFYRKPLASSDTDYYVNKK